MEEAAGHWKSHPFWRRLKWTGGKYFLGGVEEAWESEMP